MAYGFVLMAPAPFFFAPRPFDGSTGRLLLALTLSAQGLARAANLQTDSLIYIYSPFLLTTCVWLLILNAEAQQQTSPGLDADRASVRAAA